MCSLIAQTNTYDIEQLDAGALQITTRLKHKYGDSVPVHIKVTTGGAHPQTRALALTKCSSRCILLDADCNRNILGVAWQAGHRQRADAGYCAQLSPACRAGTANQRILVLNMRQLEETAPMGAFDQEGQLVYVNSPFAALLGYQLHMMKHKDITQLMPQPYGVFHLSYLKVLCCLQGLTATTCMVLRKCCLKPDYQQVASLHSQQLTCSDGCLLLPLAGHRAHSSQSSPWQLPQQHDRHHAVLQQHASVRHPHHPAACSSCDCGRSGAAV